MYLVVGDELFCELLSSFAVALVVVREERHFFLLPIDVDSAGRVHPREPQVIGERLFLAFVGEAACQCERGADANVVGCLRGTGPGTERCEQSEGKVGEVSCHGMLCPMQTRGSLARLTRTRALCSDFSRVLRAMPLAPRIRRLSAHAHSDTSVRVLDPRSTQMSVARDRRGNDGAPPFFPREH